MPIYTYACDSCGHKFDLRQSFSDEPISECPACGAPVHRVVYPAGIIFKGSGWYITDSRKSNGSGESNGTNGSHAGGSGKDSSKTTETASKPAASVSSNQDSGSSSDG